VGQLGNYFKIDLNAHFFRSMEAYFMSENVEGENRSTDHKSRINVVQHVQVPCDFSCPISDCSLLSKGLPQILRDSRMIRNGITA
jgi:hypothetical protein